MLRNIPESTCKQINCKWEPGGTTQRICAFCCCIIYPPDILPTGSRVSVQLRHSPLSPCTRLRVEAKTPGTASNSSAPCHYLHILAVLWTLVFGPAQIVKFSGVATRVIRGRDCLMLASSERKLQPPRSAHFGIFLGGFLNSPKKLIQDLFPLLRFLGHNCFTVRITQQRRQGCGLCRC